MTLGAWTVLSSLSSLVCHYKRGCFVAGGGVVERQGEIDSENERRGGREQCSPLVQGRGAWDVQMKWEAPLQEVAPQHEGRGSTPPNEG